VGVELGVGLLTTSVFVGVGNGGTGVCVEVGIKVCVGEIVGRRVGGRSVGVAGREAVFSEQAVKRAVRPSWQPNLFHLKSELALRSTS
jgi:hypothetical protein